jgi:hypothetical protein
VFEPDAPEVAASEAAAEPMAAEAMEAEGSTEVLEDAPAADAVVVTDPVEAVASAVADTPEEPATETPEEPA